MSHTETIVETASDSDIMGRSKLSMRNVANSAAFILILLWSLSGHADVSGLEHLADVSVECSTTEKAKPVSVDGIAICSYTDVSCKVMDKGEFQLEANITADCKFENNECPEINACAKKKLTGAAIEAVRKKNDPNYSREDGIVNPLPSGSKSGKSGAVKR